MNCSQIQNLLPDYAVELLDGRTYRTVESHLAICADCRAELDAQNAVMALVEEFGARQPPVGLFNAVRNRIEAGDLVRERPAWWTWFNTVPARVLAMSGAVAALALGLLLPTGQGSISPGPLPPHPDVIGTVRSTALAGSIREHALSAGEGPLTDRVAWEAMAQLVSQDKDREASGVQ